MLKNLPQEKTLKIFVILFLIVTAIFGYWLFVLSNSVRGLRENFASTTLAFNDKINYLEQNLTLTTQTSQNLSQKISDQEDLTNSFERQIGGIASTVNTLEKLSKTDQELLQKYSKVYFL